MMPCERSIVLPEGVASGVLNGGDVGGVLDRGGEGGGVMALTWSQETDHDLIGGGEGYARSGDQRRETDRDLRAAAQHAL